VEARARKFGGGGPPNQLEDVEPSGSSESGGEAEQHGRRQVGQPALVLSGRAWWNSSTIHQRRTARARPPDPSPRATAPRRTHGPTGLDAGHPPAAHEGLIARAPGEGAAWRRGRSARGSDLREQPARDAQVGPWRSAPGAWLWSRPTRLVSPKAAGAQGGRHRSGCSKAMRATAVAGQQAGASWGSRPDVSTQGFLELAQLLLYGPREEFLLGRGLGVGPSRVGNSLLECCSCCGSQPGMGLDCCDVIRIR